MDRDISKKSANDKGSERANGRAAGREFEPLPLGPETEMLALHSAIGNQGVGRLLQSDGAKPGLIQAKLTVSQPKDRYEQEADRIADEVMRAPSNDVLGAPPSVTPIQTPSLQCDAISGQSTSVSPNIQTQIESLQRSGGEPLPESQRAFMQSRLGRDLSSVRVHRDSVANDLAGRLHARAFTVGNHIVFGKGQYPAGNPINSRLLTHELVHSLQQKESNQTLIQRELSTSKAEPVIELGVPEEGLQPLPDKDRIKLNSKPAKRLRKLAERMSMLMSELFGDPEVDPAETMAALIFSKSQLKIARRAAASYVNATVVIIEKVALDTAYAASWLDALISTLNEFTVLLREVATSRPEYAGMAKDLDRKAHGILRSAKKLHDSQPFVRGGTLVKKARASVVRRLENEQKKAEQQRRIEESGLNEDLLALSQAGDVEFMMFQMRAERVIQDVTGPETKARLQARIDQELKSREEIEQRGTPEPNLTAINDEMNTIESERTREGSANSLNKKLDQLDLATLAEDADGKARLTNLGLKLAESTSFQAAGQTFFGDLGKIVTERWEEEKAIERISRAIAATNKPKKYIPVTGEELTQLRIESREDKIVVKRGDVLRGIEALNEAVSNIPPPMTEDTFDPSDVVGLTWIDSNQKSHSVKVAAFALLYVKDKSINDTYEMWAMLIQLGIVVTASAIRKGAEKTASGAELLSERLGTKTAPKVGRAPIKAAEGAGFREASTSAREVGGLAPKEVGRPRGITSVDAGAESVTRKPPHSVPENQISPVFPRTGKSSPASGRPRKPPHSVPEKQPTSVFGKARGRRSEAPSVDTDTGPTGEMTESAQKVEREVGKAVGDETRIKKGPRKGFIEVPGPTEKQADAISNLQKTLRAGGKWSDLDSLDRARIGTYLGGVTEELSRIIFQGVGKAVKGGRITRELIEKFGTKGGRVLFVQGKFRRAGKVDLLEIDFNNGKAVVVDLTSTSAAEHTKKTLRYLDELQKLTEIKAEAVEFRYVGSDGELLDILQEVPIE